MIDLVAKLLIKPELACFLEFQMVGFDVFFFKPLPFINHHNISTNLDETQWWRLYLANPCDFWRLEVILAIFGPSSYMCRACSTMRHALRMRCARIIFHWILRPNALCPVSASLLLPSVSCRQLTTIFYPNFTLTLPNRFALVLLALGIEMNFKHLEKWFMHELFKFILPKATFIMFCKWIYLQTLFFSLFHFIWIL